MSCYKRGDLIRIPQNTWLFNEESLHNSLLYPKKISSQPSIACVIASEKAGDILKVFVDRECFLVRSKDVFFAKEMANAS